ncbi:MAG: CapA family protein [Clostridia bacterium]|nr:CapA family protein [Clostridia bacterium]
MTEITFSGDIAFSKYFRNTYEDPALICEDAIGFFQGSNHVVLNVEGALTDNVMTRGSASVPAHASDPRCLPWLLKMKGDVWNLSNNHTLDCGEGGLADTLALARANGCQPLGAGMNIHEASAPILFPEEGGIGILAVSYKAFMRADENKAGVLHWDDFGRIREAIQKIKKTNRWCILVAHGGEEFSGIPMPYVRRRYLNYLKMGADIIVAHHPHVPQNFETVGNKVIFYSLGNFIFDTDYQRLQKYTDRGILLKLKLTEDTCEWEHFPYRIDRELHRVVPDETPHVFRNVCAKEYRALAPVGVANFLRDYAVAKIFLHPEMEHYTKFQWFKWYWKEKGKKETLSLCLHALLYRVGNRKKAEQMWKEHLGE